MFFFKGSEGRRLTAGLRKKLEFAGPKLHIYGRTLNGFVHRFQKELQMGKKEAARQKQLAKKKAKRDDKRREVARRTSPDPTIALAQIAKTPVYDAQIPASMEQGIGVALLARRLPDGHIAFASYLLDTYCLGVKDAFWRIASPGEYAEHLEQMQHATATRKVSGDTLAKLVFGAVEFARSYGFAPHVDFRHAAKLLEGLNPAAGGEEFEFGQNGKPFYIQGPHDSLARIKQIMGRLGREGGSAQGELGEPRGHFLVNPSGMDAKSLVDLYEEFVENEDSDKSELVDMSDPDSAKK
jgi:hypothetical protein